MDGLKEIDQIAIDKMVEIWRKITGYDNYEVSNRGRVRNTIANKILADKIDKDGYKLTTLSRETKQKTCRVHRLVAEAFIVKLEGKKQVDHNHKTTNQKLKIRT
jgi:hypothetical protein